MLVNFTIPLWAFALVGGLVGVFLLGVVLLWCFCLVNSIFGGGK